MTPATAREIGGNLIDAAARAEAELALYRTIDTVMGDDEEKEQMAALAISFYRGVQIEQDRHGADTVSGIGPGDNM